MKRLLAVLPFLLLVPAPAVADKPKPTEWTPELMMTVQSVGAVQPSPDGKRVAYVVGEAVMDGEKSEMLSQIHVANADPSGSSSRSTRPSVPASSTRTGFENVLPASVENAISACG